MTKSSRPYCLFFLAVALAVVPGTSHAAQIVNALFDTSSLAGKGAFYINFQLTNGDPFNSNTVSSTSFNFGSGMAGSSSTVQTIGSVTGSLNTGTVTLSDGAFLNDFVQAFTPSSALGFQVTLTPPAFSGGTPDLFSFAILDSGFVEVPTIDPFGTNRLLVITIDSPMPLAQRFQLASTVPEPATPLLLAIGLAGVGAAMLVRRRAKVRKELVL